MSDVNMDLAERIIEQSTSGALQQAVMRSSAALRADVTSSDDLAAQDATAQGTAPSKNANKAAVDAEVDVDNRTHALQPPQLASQVTSDRLSVNTAETCTASSETLVSPTRSKYANVLEQINLDYARHIESSIKIFYPVAVDATRSDTTVRSTWPLAGRNVDEEVEFASDALQLLRMQRDFDSSLTSQQLLLDSSTAADVTSSVASAAAARPQRFTAQQEAVINRKSVKIKPQYLEQFDSVINQLQLVCREPVPTLKLQYAFKAMHALSKKVQQIHEDVVRANGCDSTRGNVPMAPSADDLTDFLVVLLCNCDIDLVKSLYLNVHIMRDHICERFETGPYGYALMQLTICLHFLQERIVMQRGLMENQMDARTV